MSGTNCLNSLATKTLERLSRNKARNRIGTNGENLVPQLIGDGTRIKGIFISVLELQDAYEERVAIAQYDGKQQPEKAIKIAQTDMVNTILMSFSGDG